MHCGSACIVHSFRVLHLTMASYQWIPFLLGILILVVSSSLAFQQPKLHYSNQGNSYQALASSRVRARLLDSNQVTHDKTSPSLVFRDTVTILDESPHHLVVSKPPSVVCHHSDWTGSRSNKVLEVPMLQRVREAMGGHKVNLIHRLDRGASGCLLLTYRDNKSDSTAAMCHAMSQANKTYVALVRGEGILRGVDLKTKGWFQIDRPIKNERGHFHNATTFFRFLAGQGSNLGEARAALVLARPVTGRWHQVRRHLNGLSHPILGDSVHGDSKINQEWKTLRGLPPERLCLHLLEVSLPPTELTPTGIKVTCPVPDDMMTLLRTHLPKVLRDSESALQQEGLSLEPRSTRRTIPIEMVFSLY